MYTAPNGLNLSKSVTNPDSRLNRVRSYLHTNGPRTKRDILRDVFGHTIGVNRYEYTPTMGWHRIGPKFVTRSWGSYLFTLAVRYGYITKTRKGNTVLYSNNYV